MSDRKQKLVPMSVPWMVATSAPFVRVHCLANGQPWAVTFVAYFKLSDTEETGVSNKPYVAQEPSAFKALAEPDYNPYHLVQIEFSNAVRHRVMPAVSDSEVIRESDFDWSNVPGTLRLGEDAKANFERTTRFWLEHKICPDPGVYVVEESRWLSALGESDKDLRHYLIVGQDEYVEVIAQSAACEIGQAVT